MNARLCRVATAVGIAALALSGSAGATAIFTGSGNTDENNTAVTAEADFTLSASTLTLLLTNTSSPTTAQGDALTGVIFSINGTQTLSFDMVGPPCGETLPAGSHIWDSTTTTDDTINLCGSWTSELSSPPKFPAEFGVATTGYNGEFNGGSITQGNASPDFGIVAAGSFPAASFGGSRFPFIQNALQFQFSVDSGSFAESDITGVAFMFGTRGDTVITGECQSGCTPIQQIPEPGSLALLGLGALGLAATRRQRKR